MQQCTGRVKVKNLKPQSKSTRARIRESGVKPGKGRISQKVKHAEAAIQRAEEFVVDAGGDLTSQTAVPVGLEFMSAFADFIWRVDS
jgi:lipopolysaccharide biosynthesis regulator YciM